MKAVTYIPHRDELLAEFGPRKLRPSKQIGHFTLWWDDEGNICAIRISAFLKEQEDFKRDFNETRLGGIWKGLKITDKDIKKSRRELLKRLEEKW